jgi:ribosomal protein L11 methyltransferase
MGGDSIDNVPTINPTKSFDLIVTNILARVHISLVENYRHSLRQTDGCMDLLITAGFTTEQGLNEWVALAYRIKE